MRPSVIMAMLLIASLPARGDDAVLTFHPAHWVERQDALRPRVAAFSFRDMAFRSPDDGWFVSNQFILHVTGDRLEVAFPRFHGLWPSTIAFAGAETGWITGYAREGPRRGKLYRYQAGAWHRDARLDHTYLAGRDWSIGNLLPVAPDDIGLLVKVTYGRDPLYYQVFGAALLKDDEWLRFDGERWRFTPSLLSWPGVFPTETCHAGDGTHWVAGRTAWTEQGYRALVARRRNGGWQDVSLPQDHDQLSSVIDLACVGHGEVVALVGGSDEPLGAVRRLSLLRFDGAWHRLPLPEGVEQGHSATMAARSADELWLVTQCTNLVNDCPARFWSWRDGQWTEAPPPYLPGGRRNKYSVTRLVFPSPEQGWAIATDMHSPPLRGLIFHYRDGVWRNRNWDWHFWDQPWFGLLGY